MNNTSLVVVVVVVVASYHHSTVRSHAHPPSSARRIGMNKRGGVVFHKKVSFGPYHTPTITPMPH